MTSVKLAELWLGLLTAFLQWVESLWAMRRTVFSNETTKRGYRRWIDLSEKCLGDGGFSGWRTTVEAEEEAAARKLKRRLRRDVLDGLAGYVKGDERDDLNGLMRGNAERAVRIRMPGGVAVYHLHDSNHQHQRDADDPYKSYPGGARA